MNSLAGRSVLSLCRQAAGGPAVKTLMNQGQRAVRATGLAPASLCHSGAGQQRAINVKKRGYDVTRNPHLNKVYSSHRRHEQEVLEAGVAAGL